MANKYLPIGISVVTRTCLVVGGGVVALRKVETLLDYETGITVIAPKPDAKIEYHAEQGRIELIKREYTSPEAGKYGLVIAASSDAYVNQEVYNDAISARVPVNVVDNPPLCDFVFPAITKRDCLTVAVSTDGQAPFLAGFLREFLDGIFPDRWCRIAGYAGKFRRMVMKEGPKEAEKKQKCLQRFLNADWKVLLKDKDEEALEAEFQDWLKV
ncbi:MAG: bifunctional precorrin-2 dehydrogenase/sirohydrochlorin ferrochelatase [candidate division Zixibacteria bacterium]|jgi:uroporphyrin-III C-methyltransferase/precorrin-2 dehydrogenase/sirohydrochlorin ferrochelatase|nr:bifunctional precorrin-2 dehydrogenase/sirohydrochlorin ferrochelatase [candidate division Zixibacteria bacterium]